jgi:hypothetical protein
VKTPSRVVPGCGSSVIVANPSGNCIAGEQAPMRTATVPACPAMAKVERPLREPSGLASLQISIRPA